MPVKLKRFRLGSINPSVRCIQQRGSGLICSSTNNVHWLSPTGRPSTMNWSWSSGLLSNRLFAELAQGSSGPVIAMIPERIRLRK